MSRTAVFLGGLGATAVSIASGFIWAYEQRLALVFACSLVAWSGYLAAHYAVTGTIVDDPPDGVGITDWRTATLTPDSTRHAVGIAVGLCLLVAGMYVGSTSVRAHDHVVTTLGATTFLAGYVIAHYAATGKAL